MYNSNLNKSYRHFEIAKHATSVDLQITWKFLHCQNVNGYRLVQIPSQPSSFDYLQYAKTRRKAKEIFSSAQFEIAKHATSVDLQITWKFLHCQNVNGYRLVQIPSQPSSFDYLQYAKTRRKAKEIFSSAQWYDAMIEIPGACSSHRRISRPFLVYFIYAYPQVFLTNLP